MGSDIDSHYILTIVKPIYNAAMSTRMQVLFKMLMLILLDIHPEVALLDHI
jgi:hypothetical protein